MEPPLQRESCTGAGKPAAWDRAKRAPIPTQEPWSAPAGIFAPAASPDSPQQSSHSDTLCQLWGTDTACSPARRQTPSALRDTEQGAAAKVSVSLTGSGPFVDTADGSNANLSPQRWRSWTAFWSMTCPPASQ